VPIGLPPAPPRPQIVKRGVPCRDLSENFVEYTREDGWGALRVFDTDVVGDATYEALMTACRACPHAQEYASGVMHCLCATCRRWVGLSEHADLRTRNRHAGQRCPRVTPPAIWASQYEELTAVSTAD
jgi:hypothetical protein